MGVLTLTPMGTKRGQGLWAVSHDKCMDLAGFSRIEDLAKDLGRIN